MNREPPAKSRADRLADTARELGTARRRTERSALRRTELSAPSPFAVAAKNMGLGPRNERVQASLKRTRLEP